METKESFHLSLKYVVSSFFDSDNSLPSMAIMVMYIYRQNSNMPIFLPLPKQRQSLYTPFLVTLKFICSSWGLWLPKSRNVINFMCVSIVPCICVCAFESDLIIGASIGVLESLNESSLCWFCYLPLHVKALRIWCALQLFLPNVCYALR